MEKQLYFSIQYTFLREVLWMDSLYIVSFFLRGVCEEKGKAKVK